MDFHPHPNPVNLGSVRGQYILEESMEEFGAGRGVVATAEGTVIVGIRSFEIAMEKGFGVHEVHSSGDRIIAARRNDLDLTGAKAQALAYVDNQSSAVGITLSHSRILADHQRGISHEPYVSTGEKLAMAKGIARQLDAEKSGDSPQASVQRRIAFALPVDLLKRYEALPGKGEERLRALLGVRHD